MPVAVDFFSGVGGLSLGLEQAGFEAKIKVEIEEITGRYASYNSPDSMVLYGEEFGDIRKFDPKRSQALNDVIDQYGSVDLIAGGPPCQGFSLAGKKQHDDPLNDLILEFARVVSAVQPKAFLIENVPGIQIGGSEKLRQTIDTLSAFYNISGPETLCAWDFGVPQTRKRVFILGYHKDTGVIPKLPTPSHQFSTQDQQTLFLKRTPSCWEAISDLPDCDAYDHLLSGDRVAYAKSPENDYQRIMRGHLRGDDLSCYVCSPSAPMAQI